MNRSHTGMTFKELTKMIYFYLDRTTNQLIRKMSKTTFSMIKN